MRVYLSQSKVSDPHLVASVRSYFTSIYGVEVVEYKGGTYNVKPLTDSDIMVMVGPHFEKNCPNGIASTEQFYTYVGKGQVEQFKHFKSVTLMKNNIFIVVGDNNKWELQVATGIIEDEINWTDSYGRIFSIDEPVDLERKCLLYIKWLVYLEKEGRKPHIEIRGLDWHRTLRLMQVITDRGSVSSRDSRTGQFLKRPLTPDECYDPMFLVVARKRK